MQRRYSLPNCTLVLEGLSNTIGDVSGTGVVSTLVNAECHIQGEEQPLSGGREFLESLIRSVSQYAQSILSGVRPPLTSPSEVVRIAPVEGHHRLSVAASDNGETPAQVDLSTVELFDLVEAIDQLLADGNTLPELVVPLQPLSRQFSNTSVPLATRAAAPALGLSSVAIAALVLALVPIPEKVEPPVDPVPEEVESVEGDGLSAAGTGTDDPPSGDSGQERADADSGDRSNGDETDSVELSAGLEAIPEITDPDRIAELNEELFEQIDETWEERSSVVTDLTYRVSVSDDGSIIGYRPVSDSAKDYDGEIPLQDLAYIPPQGGRAESESAAQFKVVFQDNGEFEVSPWDGDPEETTQLDSESEFDDNQSRLEESDTRQSDTDESLTEESRLEESGVEESDTRQSDTDESRLEESGVEESDTRRSDTDESRLEESRLEESRLEESDTRQSDTDESLTEESRLEESGVEESDTRQSDSDESRLEESGVEESDTRRSDTDESRTEESRREEFDSIEQLWAQTQGSLYDEWADLPRVTFEERLEYRVGVSKNGDLAQVEPINQPAFDYINETPLDGVERVAPGERNDPDDVEFFKVVFTPGGVIEMSLWDGRN